MRKHLVFGFVTAAVLGTAMACVTSPETGRTQLSLVPESQMTQLGAQAYQETLSKSKVSKNAALNKEVAEIGRRIAQASGVDYDWEFTVIDEPQTVNAFCLPGGKVAVYTGIIPVAKNNAALAAVMGHEVAHAVLRHSGERMSQQMVMQMGLAATTLTFSDSKYKNTIAGLLGVGAQFGIALPFSRYHESEADRVGLEYMAKAGYDPREAVGLWERMGAMGGGSRP
ncbi:MAG: M48 family metallopeptidase, partial [Pseudobdellovibrionaceae bacterium]|nr:M48 family metallopeptidase [Pseudobdellovibrionaceae bacterium]